MLYEIRAPIVAGGTFRIGGNRDYSPAYAGIVLFVLGALAASVFAYVLVKSGHTLNPSAYPMQ